MYKIDSYFLFPGFLCSSFPESAGSLPVAVLGIKKADKATKYF